MNKRYQLSWDLWPKAGMLEGYPSTDYFCIHTLIAPAIIYVGDELYSMPDYGNYHTPSLQYSYDKANWFDIPANRLITITNCAYFKSPTEHTIWSGSFSCNKPFYVSGKLSTLINPNPDAQTVHIPHNGFQYLFSSPNIPEGFSLDYLLSAKYLLFNNLIDDLGVISDSQSESLSSANYRGAFRGMFRHCGALVPPDTINPINVTFAMCEEMFRYSGIKYMPSLPTLDLGRKTITSYKMSGSVGIQVPFATVDNITNWNILSTVYYTSANCYLNMFADCRSLTTISNLPATSLSKWSYSSMFRNCVNLITAPAIAAITVVYECFYEMFANCTKLENPATIIETLQTYTYNSNYLFRGYGTGASNDNSQPIFRGMYLNCTNLKYMPKLPKLDMSSFSYSEVRHPDYPCLNMLKSCTQIKLTASTTTETPYVFKIPYAYQSFLEDTDDIGVYVVDNNNSKPALNTTYYCNLQTIQ